MSNETEAPEKALAALRAGKSVKEAAEASGLEPAKVRALAAASGIKVPKGKPGRPKGSGKKVGSPSSGSSAGSAPSGSSAPGGSGTPHGSPDLVQAPPGAPLADHVAGHPAGPPFTLGGPGPLPGAEGTPPPPAPAPTAPAIDGEALFAVVVVAKATVVSNVAMVYGLSLTEAQTEKLCGFTTQEEKALKTLAPHAAAYTSGLEKYARGAMAVLFVAMVGASTARSLKELQSLKPKPVDPNRIPAKHRDAAKGPKKVEEKKEEVSK